MRFAASRSAPRRSRSWCTRRPAGNPFFAIQFMSSLAEEGLLTFDHDAARWSWDLDRIHAKGYTDNVVDLMVGKLTRLPAETQNALQQLACLGNIAEITTLSIVLGTSEEQVHAALWPAVRQELVERLGGRLPVRPRSRSGSRLFADPGRAARRGAPSDQAGCSRRTPSREAGGGDLRHRQSAQPRRCA